jgi:hypothetical protein
MSKPKNKTGGVDKSQSETDALLARAALPPCPRAALPATPSACELLQAALKKNDDRALADVIAGIGHNRGPPLAEDKTDVPDELVPDPQVWREFHISSMTGWRWSRDPNLGFPVAVQVNGRNFRSRRALERFKARLLRRAIAERAKRKTASARALVKRFGAEIEKARNQDQEETDHVGQQS